MLTVKDLDEIQKEIKDNVMEILDNLDTDDEFGGEKVYDQTYHDILVAIEDGIDLLKDRIRFSTPCLHDFHYSNVAKEMKQCPLCGEKRK